MIRKAGIENTGHIRRVLKILGEFLRIRAGPLHTDGEGSDAADHEPAVKRRKSRAVGCRRKADAFCGFRVLQNNKTADGVVMTADELCSAVNNDVGAEIKRVLKAG